MKFLYAYKQSDGKRLEGQVAAASREEAFSLLRQQGIRAIKVWPDPVSERRQSVVKKVIYVLVAAALSLLVFVVTRSVSRRVPMQESVNRVYSASPRSQSVAQVDAGAVFVEHPAERFLAAFAVPGRRVELQLTDDVRNDFFAALENKAVISPDDSPEVAELKRVVSGIKDDVLIQIASGRGVVDAVEWLVSRQTMEAGFFDNAVRELSGFEKHGEELYELKRNEINRRLAAMGLPLLERKQGKPEKRQ